jgi:phospholipase C
MAKKKSSGRKIDHVIVLMLENRSFDHIFGFRPGVEGLKGDEENLADPSKPAGENNPAFFVDNGAPYMVPVGNGPGHSINATNIQLFGDKNPPKAAKAKNDGFVKSYNGNLIADHVRHPSFQDQHVVMQSFSGARLPSINHLADEFVLCDHWFSEVPGPTQPNRLFAHAATSGGFAHNVFEQIFDVATIYEQIQKEGLTWATYELDKNEVREFSRINKQNQNFKRYDEAFAIDVNKGTLANYSFIFPRFFNADHAVANSEHAPEDMRFGDNFIADVYETLRKNEDVWKRSALIVTYDEHGGFFDHVAPPTGVPNPDGINSPPPGDKASFAPKFDFRRLGMRVPAVIVSPWVRPHVVSTPYQHTSIMATVRKIFGMKSGPLTKRDKSAKTFDDLFELDQPRTDTPTKLRRVALPKLGAPKDDPRHPANLSMDDTQRAVLFGVHKMTWETHGRPMDDLPLRQGDASRYIRYCYERHFGPPGEPGKVPRPPRKRKR